MENKEQLVKVIREWVKLDNDMKVLKTEMSKRKKEKDLLSVRLIETMKQNQIDEFDINDGRIMYNKKTVKKPITKKMLLNILTTYYNEDGEKAVEVNNYILDHREDVLKETIMRKLREPTVPL